jgi:hypothetical protein
MGGKTGIRAPQGRSLSLNTNFNPDQVSSIAQTFTSTSPPPDPKARTPVSLRSPGTGLRPFVSLGQESHNMPSGESSRTRAGIAGASPDPVRQKAWMKSNGGRMAPEGPFFMVSRETVRDRPTAFPETWGGKGPRASA